MFCNFLVTMDPLNNDMNLRENTSCKIHYFEVLSDKNPAELEHLYDYCEGNYLGHPARHGQR